MSLTDLPLPPELVSMLNGFDGVVIEYAMFKCFADGSGAEPSPEVLRLAARKTVERSLPDFRHLRAPNGLGTDDPIGFINEAGLAAAVPKPLAWDEFLGPWWDAGGRRLRGMNEPEYYGELRGYAHAFAHPPYGLRPRGQPFEGSKAGPGAAADKAFLRINQLLLGTNLYDRRVKIWNWPTDWSRYFDAGREWWGSYCWTLWFPPEYRVVGIAASSTD